MNTRDVDPDDFEQQLKFASQYCHELEAYDEQLRQQRLTGREQAPDAPDTLSLDVLQPFRQTQELLHFAANQGTTATPPNPSGPTGRPVQDATESDTLGRVIPRQIGRFRLIRQIGRGGCGLVFAATDPSLDRLVAVKIPQMGALQTAEAKSRFCREAQAAARLDHPNIVSVFEAGEWDEVHYIVSAYCAGSDLAQWLRSCDQLPSDRDSARLIATLADAVHHAHESGILHRDLKPGNVLLTHRPGDGPTSLVEATGRHDRTDELATSTPMITDFGLAKWVDRDETRTGEIVGTVDYMAPEQAAGQKELGPGIDIYSLGVILYELLIGQRPFQGESTWETLQLIRQGDLVLPRRFRPAIDRDLETICLKCLEYDPQSRYATAAELRDDLHRFLQGRPVRARRLGPAARTCRWTKRNPMMASLSAMAMGFFLLFVIGLMVSNHTRKLNIVRQYRLLWDAHLSTVRLSQTSLSIGRRTKGLQAIQDAHDMATLLHLGEESAILLRSQSVAILALSDLLPEDQIETVVPNADSRVAWGPRLERIAYDNGVDSILVRDFPDQATSIRCRRPKGELLYLRFSPDGTALSAGFTDADATRVFRWALPDRHRGSTVEPLDFGLASDRAAVEFVADGRQIIIPGPHGRTLRIHDTQTGKQAGAIDVDGVDGCRVSGDAKQIVVWKGQALTAYAYPQGQQKWYHEVENGVQQITCVDWSDSDLTLAVGASDHSVYVFNLEDGVPLQCEILNGHEDWIESAAFTAADRLMTTDRSGEMRWWDLNTGRTVLITSGRNLARSSQRDRIAAGFGGSLFRWTVLDDRVRRPGWNGFTPYEAYDFAQIGESGSALSCTNSAFDVWNLDTQQLLWSIPVDQTPTEIVLATHEKVIANCDDRLFVYEFDSRLRNRIRSEQIELPPRFGHMPIRCRASADGLYVAASAGDEIAIVATTEDDSNSNRRRRFPIPGLATFDLSRSGDWLVSATSNRVTDWDTRSGRKRHELVIDGIGDVQIGPRDRIVAIGVENAIQLWRRSNWERMGALNCHPLRELTFEFSPDGKTLIAQSRLQKQLIVFDLATGKRVFEIPTRRQHPWVRITADGRFLIHQGPYMSVEFLDLSAIRERWVELKLMD